MTSYGEYSSTVCSTTVCSVCDRGSDGPRNKLAGELRKFISVIPKLSMSPPPHPLFIKAANNRKHVFMGVGFYFNVRSARSF